MERQFEQFAQARKNLVNLLKNTEDIYTIPNGFKNNIFWNAAHVLVTQQLLCYKLSENEMNLSEEIIDAYRKGAKAEEHHRSLISKEELIDKLLEQTKQIKADYEKGLFVKYAKYPTSFGVELNSIEDAISFNNIHEGLHLGYVMAMKKSL
jgi:hypothetical protein